MKYLLGNKKKIAHENPKRKVGSLAVSGAQSRIAGLKALVVHASSSAAAMGRFI